MRDYAPDNQFQYTEIDVRAALDYAASEAGGAGQWAEQNEINPQWLELFRMGLRIPAPALLRALGFEQRVFYRRLGTTLPARAHVAVQGMLR